MGKDADLVVFSGHPFDYRTVVELVLVDGQVAYKAIKDPSGFENPKGLLALG